MTPEQFNTYNEVNAWLDRYVADKVAAALAAERARVAQLVNAAEQMLRFIAQDHAVQMTDAVHDLAAAVNRIKEASRGPDV